MKLKSALLFLLAVLLNGALIADLKFFWLDRPKGRDNPHDPGSPLYRTPTAVAPAGTRTETPTFTVSPTLTFSLTLTVTPTYSVTNTPNGTLTNSPTITATFSVSPSSTVTPTYSNTPTAPTATPTSCAVPPCHGPLVADFEEADNSVDLWGGNISTSCSSDAPTSVAPNPWVAGSATGGGDPGQCGCFSGNVGTQSAPLWPWSSFMFNLNTTPGMDTDISSYVVNHGLTFNYKATVANVGYRVRLRMQTVDGTSGSAPYSYDFTPSDTSWHTLTVYFPGDGLGNAEFAQPGWATAAPFTTMCYGVEFIPLGNGSSASAYGLCVDDVTFASPAPVAQPKTFENFEDANYNSSNPPPSYLLAPKYGGGAASGTATLETTNLVPSEAGHALTYTISLGSSSDWMEMDCENGATYGGNVDMTGYTNFIQFSCYIDQGPVDVSPSIYDGTTFAAYAGPTLKLTAGGWQTFKVALNSTNFPLLTGVPPFDFTKVHVFAVTVGPDAGTTLPLSNANFFLDDLAFTQ
jgi:hypothetical protein